MPSRPAARHTSTGSPDGSAAASCSSRRVWAGRASSCRREARPRSGRTAGAAPGRPNPPASSAGVSPRGSSSSASGLPVRLGDDQVADPRVQRPGQRRVQQRPRVVLPQPLHLELGQPGQLVPGYPGREHQADRVGGQPPRHEPQRLRRGPVEPLLVVDHADQRLLPGHLRQQAQHGQPDQEPVRRRAGGRRRTRSAARRAAAPGSRSSVVQHRRAQLMQPGERQLHLRLHAHRARHPAPVRPVDQVVQQRGLAHARVAAHHQRPALTGPDRLDQPVEHVAFADAGPSALSRVLGAGNPPPSDRHYAAPVRSTASGRTGRRPGQDVLAADPVRASHEASPAGSRPRLGEAATCHAAAQYHPGRSAARTNSQESARPATRPPVASARALGKSPRPWRSVISRLRDAANGRRVPRRGPPR